jgi:hypothetical protein
MRDAALFLMVVSVPSVGTWIYRALVWSAVWAGGSQSAAEFISIPVVATLYLFALAALINSVPNKKDNGPDGDAAADAMRGKR